MFAQCCLNGLEIFVTAARKRHDDICLTRKFLRELPKVSNCVARLERRQDSLGACKQLKSIEGLPIANRHVGDTPPITQPRVFWSYPRVIEPCTARVSFLDLTI